MLWDLQTYVLSIARRPLARNSALLALLLVIAAPIAEADWAGGACMAGAAVSFGAMGFFAWRGERMRRAAGR